VFSQVEHAAGHHSEGGWVGELAFEALLDVDPDLFDLLAPHVPRFRFLLEDLSGVSEEALQQRAMSALGRLALWCLKNARTPEEILRRMRAWAGLVREEIVWLRMGIDKTAAL
jgi:hypothetical protein